mmetsp:Transcript_6606/g.20780  ORF Transcript_6606/g.20780 Transcript_6606/m.20780 type:complete len:88 (-) Transcript_6606:298-561(-)
MSVVDLTFDDDVMVDQNSKGDLPSSAKCPVCGDILVDKKLLSTKCGHVFCDDCLTKFMESKKHCPSCNAKCDSRDLRQVYINRESDD